jgi:DNA-binding winged helix-turn-helix (wHTH) protein/TolB-like protein
MKDSLKTSERRRKGDSEIFQFGPYQLRAAEKALYRDGKILAITPKALETLLVLVENHGKVVGKDDLMQAVWPDAFVEEGILAQNVSTLRRTLENPDWIVTVPKRGYRFAAPVTAVRSEATTVRWRALSARAIPVMGAVLVLVALAAFLGVRWERAKARAGAFTIRSLAVLPFRGISTEPSYLGLGLADMLINRLGTLPQISVRPTNAVRKFAGASVDPVVAGRELGVDAVLDGNIQRDGDRVRVTVQLLRIPDGVSLWTAKFDQRYSDLFTVEDSMAGALADGLILDLTAAERERLMKRYTQNAEAWQAYLRGRYLWNRRTAETHQQAIDEFEQATRIDPNYALAYAGLADAYALLGSNPNGVMPRAEAMSRARAAALKAIELDNSLAEAHTPLAFILMHYDWNVKDAETEFQRAISLNPSYATARQWHAINLLVAGHPDAAIEELNKAMALDPTSLIIGTDLAEIYLNANRPVEAEAAARRVLELDPAFATAQFRLAWALQAQRRYADAAAQVPEERFGDDPERLVVLTGSQAAMGKSADARHVLDRLVREADNRHAEFQVAEAYASIGDVEHMLPWLEKAFAVRDGALLMLNMNQRFAPVRSDARFRAFTARVGLPVVQ